jgi:regulator of replication initiation timing
VNRGGEDPTQDPWTVDYGRVTPLLTKAIQEQQVEIESLREQIGRQDARLKMLVSENTKLRAVNDKLSAMSAEMEALKKTVAAVQSKDRNGVHALAVNK